MTVVAIPASFVNTTLVACVTPVGTLLPGITRVEVTIDGYTYVTGSSALFHVVPWQDVLAELQARLPRESAAAQHPIRHIGAAPLQ